MSKLLMMLLNLLIITIFLDGCSWCTEIEYRDRIEIVEKKVMVKCETPEPKHCNWSNGSTAEVPVKMLECIIEQKKLLGKCKGK